MIKSVWASYCGDDSQPLVEEVKNLLDEQGINLRLFRSESGGDKVKEGEYIAKLTNLIGKSPAVAIFFSDNFPDRDYCRNELHAVLRHKKNNTFAAIVGDKDAEDIDGYIDSLAEKVVDDGEFPLDTVDHYQPLFTKEQLVAQLQNRFKPKVSCRASDAVGIAASIVDYLKNMLGNHEKFGLVEKFLEWISLDEQSEFHQMFDDSKALTKASGQEPNIDFFAASVFGSKRDLACVKCILPLLKPYAAQNKESVGDQIEVFAGFFALTIFSDEFFLQKRSEIVEGSTTVAIDILIDPDRSDTASFIASLVAGGVMGKVPRIELRENDHASYRFGPKSQYVIASIAEPGITADESEKKSTIFEALSNTLWKVTGLGDKAPIEKKAKAGLKLSDRTILVAAYADMFGDLGDRIAYMEISKNEYSIWLDWAHLFEEYKIELLAGINQDIEIPVVFLHMDVEEDLEWVSGQGQRFKYLYEILATIAR